MGDQSRTVPKSTATVQPRTWAKTQESDRQLQPSSDPFGWQSEGAAGADGDGDAPSGGFSLLDSPMPVQPQLQRQEDESDEDFEIQAKCASCEAEESLQRQPEAGLEEGLEETLGVQAKLSIGQPGDRYEQEADSVAAQVMKMPDPSLESESLQRQELGSAEEEDTHLQTQPLAGQISQGVQLKAAGKSNSNQASAGLETSLKSQGGKGQPLGQETRNFMESRFGSDLGGVRVHTDEAAVKMNREVGAKAFTHGQDIYFNSGQYNPGSSSGKELLAHELTHTHQQGGDELARKIDGEAQAKNKLQNRDEEIDQNKKDIKLDKTNFQEKHSSQEHHDIQEEQHNSVENPSLEPSHLKSPLSDADAKVNGGDADIKETKETSENPHSENQPSKRQETQENPSSKHQKKQQQKPAKTSSSLGGSSSKGQKRKPPASPGLSMLGGGTDANTSENVDEKSEADAVQKRLREVEPEADDSTELSASEKAVAVSELASATAKGEIPSGGGGGGSAIEETPEEPAPELAGSEPEAAVSALGGLSPTQIHSSLGGVNEAINNTVSQEREELAASPPEVETPEGKEMSVADQDIAEAEPAEPVEKAPEGQDIPVEKPDPAPPIPPSPPIPVEAPPILGDEEGKMSDADLQNLQASVAQIPTHDPNPPSFPPGAAPPLRLEGNADPQQAEEQNAELTQSSLEEGSKGEQEIAQPMGEDELYATLPAETLTAETTGQEGASEAVAMAETASTALGGGTSGVDPISVIAQEEKGDEIDAAVANAQGEIATQRSEHELQVAAEQEKTDQEIEQLKQENAEQQDRERHQAQAEVDGLRQECVQEQDSMISEAQAEADGLVAQGLNEVETERNAAELAATQEIQKGEEEAEVERRKGEENAAKEKSKGREESQGFFGWAADKVKGAFENIKNAVKLAIDRAREAMRAAIEKAKELATQAIEFGRKAIVSIIQRVGDAVLAVADRLLADLPELRDKFRNFIEEKVQEAEDTINTLAEHLNEGIQNSLNLLAAGLDAALSLMESGMLAVVDSLESTVSGALEFAEGIVATAGQFAAIIPDIAANTGQWVSNLAAGAKDGVRNHLWSAFQEQTKAWFSGKITSILGVPPEILQQVISGGMSMGEIAQMAWQAIKSAVPAILIRLIIENIVALVIPVAGAVKKVIEGLIAAWGTVGSILSAFGVFLDFLKTVKTGNAGPSFAQVIASAGVVVIEFISNWLIQKLISAAKKFAAKLKGIAKGLAQKFSRNKNNKNKAKPQNSKEKNVLDNTQEKDDINQLSDDELKTELEVANNKKGSLKEGGEVALDNGHEISVESGLVCRASKNKKCKNIKDFSDELSDDGGTTTPTLDKNIPKGSTRKQPTPQQESIKPNQTPEGGQDKSSNQLNHNTRTKIPDGAQTIDKRITDIKKHNQNSSPSQQQKLPNYVEDDPQNYYYLKGHYHARNKNNKQEFPVPQNIRKELYNKHGYDAITQERLSDGDKTIDHIFPQNKIKDHPLFGQLSKGNQNSVMNDPHNLQVLSRANNSSKGARTNSAELAKLHVGKHLTDRQLRFQQMKAENMEKYLGRRIQELFRTQDSQTNN